MSASILQIILKVTKEGTGDRDAARAAKELKGTLQDLGLGSLASASALGLVVGAMTAVATFTKQAVDETVKYADQVRSMMQLTGQSAEESSRMIQVMDDLKVKTEVLTMATKTLSKEGLTMNIETLAKLSDEYNQLNTGAEKSRFLVEKFGKSGLAMAEAMEQGGEKLREMNGAVEESLVLNDEAVENARQYQRELDNLNDSWMAIKITVGNAVIPALLDLISAQEQVKNATEALNKAEKEHAVIIANSPEAAAKLRQAHQQQEDGADSATKSYIAMGNALKNVTSSSAEAEEAAKALSNELKNQLSVIGKMQSVEESYTEKARENAAERVQIEAEKAEYLAQYGDWNVEKLAEFDAALAENSAAAQQNAAEHELATKKIILGMLEQQLAMDGLTQGEFEALLAQGQAWGIYSADVVAKAKAAQDEVQALADEIDRTPSQKTVTINVQTRYSDAQSQAGGYAYQYSKRGYASGTEGWETVPSGYPNDTYPIALSSGEKFAVIPAGAGGGGGASGNVGGGFSMNVTYAPLVSLDNQGQLASALYPAFLTMLQRAKSDGAVR
jgi:hypothetical protein